MQTKAVMLEHPFDIETVPDQRPGAYQEYLQREMDDFKAPSDLSKKQACLDMGVDDQSDGPGGYKYKTKAECIAEWEERFATIKSPEVAEQKWLKTSFDGAMGEVICISGMVYPGETVSFWRKLGQSEGDMLQNYFDMMAAAYNGRTPMFVGHNISNFDLKFLYHRCVVLGIKPSVKLPFAGRHDRDYFDNMIAWTGHISKFISQDNLARALGLPGKPDDIDGSKVWEYVKAGQEEKVAAYCNDDVSQLYRIYNRLMFNDIEFDQASSF